MLLLVIKFVLMLAYPFRFFFAAIRLVVVLLGILSCFFFLFPTIIALLVLLETEHLPNIIVQRGNGFDSCVVAAACIILMTICTSFISLLSFCSVI